MSDGINSYIQHLENLVKAKDRGALAALRKGAGKPPGRVPEMFEHVIPYVPNGASENEENAYFLVGSLFGNYPEGTGRGNMGATFRKIRESSGSESVEGRFVALLKSPREDLPDHLRHGVALARSKSAPVNWAQLLYDIIRWEEAHGSVQREWARSYWEDRKEIDNEGIEEG